MSKCHRRLSMQSALLLTLLFLVLPLAAQSPAPETKPFLIVRGINDKIVTLQKADLDKLPRRSAKIRSQDGQDISYEGVSLADAMKRAGMDFEANLHGRSLTKYLLIEAADKYRTVFALPEFDPAFTDRLVLLATTREGKQLSPEEGPLRLIVPADKRQARWVRQVRMLTLMDAVSPAERNKKP